MSFLPLGNLKACEVTLNVLLQIAPVKVGYGGNMQFDYLPCPGQTESSTPKANNGSRWRGRYTPLPCGLTATISRFSRALGVATLVWPPKLSCPPFPTACEIRDSLLEQSSSLQHSAASCLGAAPRFLTGQRVPNCVSLTHLMANKKDAFPLHNTFYLIF